MLKKASWNGTKYLDLKNPIHNKIKSAGSYVSESTSRTELLYGKVHWQMQIQLQNGCRES